MASNEVTLSRACCSQHKLLLSAVGVIISLLLVVLARSEFRLSEFDSQTRGHSEAIAGLRNETAWTRDSLARIESKLDRVVERRP